MRTILRLFFVILAFWMMAGGAAAQPAPANLIANVSGRSVISLNGPWKAIVDPFEVGMQQRFYENRSPENKRELVEYDFVKSGSLNVPGDWNSQRPQLFFYEGAVWYEKTFKYHRKLNTRSFVYFGAANEQAKVYMNGQKLGEHQGGFTPFNFEVTDQIVEGLNFLVVEVNNRRRPDAVPAMETDWWNYGGLTRSVEIVEVPEVFIQDYAVRLQKNEMAEVDATVQLNGATEPRKVTLEIPELAIKSTTFSDANGAAEFNFPARVELWSPGSPKLYRVVIRSSGDKIEDQIGFRSVRAIAGTIFLNGKPIFLRGISMHEEAPMRGGRGLTAKDDQVLLGWAKELGCNFVRLAHYPHNEGMVRQADKMGLLVWEEIPVYWGAEWKNPAVLETAEEQLRDLVARDQNRASVIFWSISSETRNEPGRLEFLKTLAEYTRQLDGSRMITSAISLIDNTDPQLRVLNDPLGEYLDVLGLNEFLGWYEGAPEDADDTQWKLVFDKPLIVSEFGGDALYGYRGDAQTRWSERYQANLYLHQLKMIQQMPSLAGVSPWVLMDFRSPRRTLPGIQDYHNRKGLVSDRGQHKLAFYVLQKYYRDLVKAENAPPVPVPAATPEPAAPSETGAAPTETGIPATPPETVAPPKGSKAKHGTHRRVSKPAPKKKPPEQ
ncbi:MAG: glycoside hydrolase family 2 protein [Candidatus Acidiferrales bacterium]